MGDHCAAVEKENNFLPSRTTIIMNFVVFALTLQEVPFFLFTSTVGNLESSSSIMSSTTTGDFLWKEGKKKKGTAAVAKVFSIDYWSYRIILFQIISVISIAFVVASTIGMTLNTIPSIQHRNAKDEPIDNPKLALIEAICISWFTIEYLLRLAGKLYSNSVENCPV